MSYVEHLHLALRALMRMHPSTPSDSTNHAVALHAIECAIWGSGAAVPARAPRAGTGRDRHPAKGVGTANA